MRFFEFEADEKIKKEGLLDLDEGQRKDVEKLLIGEGAREKLMAGTQALDPKILLEQILETPVAALKEDNKSGIAKFNEWAYQWGPDAMTNLNAGFARGSSEFVDNEGELKGEQRLQLPETYNFLLIVWPEITEMINARPEKTMNDLWDWLTPFSYAGWIEVQDLEQLISLCRPIKLKLKKPGAPTKTK